MISLLRYYTPLGTWGEFTVDDFKCVTLENPWKNNQPNISCIPEGIYSLSMRNSPLVKRLTGYTKGWEIINVLDRSYIMIHTGNFIIDTDGCLLVGEKMSSNEQGLMITNSRNTFDKLMNKLSEKDEWYIDIRGFTVQWP